jgi:hypothetical protein
MGTYWFFNRYKASLDIFWIRDENLEESASFAISLRKSSTTLEPLSNNSVRSPWIYVLTV